jgi:hypothetical protein
VPVVWLKMFHRRPLSSFPKLSESTLIFQKPSSKSRSRKSFDSREPRDYAENLTLFCETGTALWTNSLRKGIDRICSRYLSGLQYEKLFSPIVSDYPTSTRIHKDEGRTWHAGGRGFESRRSRHF